MTADDLRALFLPHGPLYKIDVPTTDAPSNYKGAKGGKGKGKAEAGDDDDDDDDDDEDEEEDEEDSDEDEEEEEEEEEEEDAEEEEEEETEQAEAEQEEASADSDKEEEDSDDADSDEDLSSAAADNSAMEVDAQPSASSATTPAAAHTKQRGRGFAFVWFVSASDAGRALAALNGKAVQHGALERAAYRAADESRTRRAIKARLDRVRAAAQPERIMAVDWSLSKDEWEKKKETEVQEESEEEEKEEEEEDDSDTDPIAVGDVDEEGEEAEAEERPALPQPEEGTTLFIRNLPFNATELELRDLFRVFGSLRYARITMDKATNRSKGSAFVCFWTKESADKALERAAQVARESGTGANTIVPSAASAKGSNPFSMNASASSSSNHYSSILTADVSAPSSASLSLHGRLLSITPALKREDAQSLEAASAAARQKGDKRNTWLLREGVPFPAAPLAKVLSEVEVEKRLQSFTARRQQLEKNPALVVSKTRLSVRNLPLFVGDKTLKKLALHAIKAFRTEVHAGARPDLTPEEQADTTESPALAARSETAMKKFNERPTSVIQSKVVRQPDRLDLLLAASGLGRSRGYGFLEMRSFKDALKVVRWANANKDVTNLFTEWHVAECEDLIKKLSKELQGTGDDGKKEPAGGKGKKKAEEGEKDEASVKQDKAAQLKRLQKRVAEIKENGGKIDKSERGGLVMIEFSIDNVTITRKRAARADAVKASAANGGREARDEGRGFRGGSREGRDEGRGFRGGRDGGKDGGRPFRGGRDGGKDGGRPFRGGRDGGREGARPFRGGRDTDSQRDRKRADHAVKDQKAARQANGNSPGHIIGRKRMQKKSRA